MPNGLAIPPEIKRKEEESQLLCHRFFAPVVFPEQNPLNPKEVNITPRLGNFVCKKEVCTLWNKEQGECWDVTTAKSQRTIAEYAFNKINDVHIENGGA